MSSKSKINLLAILEAIDKILKYSKEINNEDELIENELLYDALLMNFVVIGEMSDRIPLEIKDKFKEIEWVKIKSFRNIIAHDYLGIDAEAVWQVIKTKIPMLKKQITNIMNKL